MKTETDKLSFKKKFEQRIPFATKGKPKSFVSVGRLKWKQKQ